MKNSSRIVLSVLLICLAAFDFCLGGEASVESGRSGESGGPPCVGDSRQRKTDGDLLL